MQRQSEQAMVCATLLNRPDLGLHPIIIITVMNMPTAVKTHAWMATAEIDSIVFIRHKLNY